MNKLVVGLLLLSRTAFSQVDLINEDFQAGIPGTYTILDQSGHTPDASVSEYTAAWISKEDPANASNLTASSTSYFNPPARADHWLITPMVTLGAFGNYISFDAKSHDLSYAEDYYVLVSTTGTAIADFTDTLLFVDDETVTWNTHVINLTEAGYDNQTLAFAFVLRTLDGFKFYMDNLKVWKEDPVGIQEITAINLNIYPNPATDIVTIESDATIELVKVYSLQGEEVFSGNAETLNVANWNAGVYTVEIRTTTGLVHKQFVKN